MKSTVDAIKADFAALTQLVYNFMQNRADAQKCAELEEKVYDKMGDMLNHIVGLELLEQLTSSRTATFKGEDIEKLRVARERTFDMHCMKSLEMEKDHERTGT
jgi:hypothetical protein